MTFKSEQSGLWTHIATTESVALCLRIALVDCYRQRHSLKVFIMWNWLSKQWEEIRGNFKFWLLGILGWIAVNMAIALIHGLSIWQ